MRISGRKGFGAFDGGGGTEVEGEVGGDPVKGETLGGGIIEKSVGFGGLLGARIEKIASAIIGFDGEVVSVQF